MGGELCLLWTVLVLAGSASAVDDQYSRAVDWLSRYGYLPPPDPHTSKLQTKEGMEKAIRVMQRFGGVPETGVLDENTLSLMSKPRCSLPDIIGSEDMLRRRRRRRRYALSGLKWQKPDLTWSVHSYPSRDVSPSMNDGLVDTILTYAFKAWSDAAPLQFKRVPSNVAKGGDIRVSFASMMHDDGYPFDGQGGTLAHAFFPSGDEVAGDTHFDDHEVWSFRGESKTVDLFTVAVHEFGHALGLSHSSTDPSIMRPYYQGPVENIHNFQLDLDDKMAIQQLYGECKCLRLFSRGEYWRFTEDRVNRQLDLDFPRDSSLWKGVPTDMDDIISWGEGDTYFFKDKQYWVVKRGRMDNEEVTPKSIGVDWLRCPAPIPTPNPRNPDCRCDIHGSVSAVGSSWFLLVSALLVVHKCV